jgi:hypothetical protein
MDREMKMGIIYIIIAIGIPLLALPFVSGYSKDKGFFENLYHIAIVIKKDKPSDSGAQPADNMEKPKSKIAHFFKLITPKRIPFRFFLVVTLIFLYIGIVRIDSARRKMKENQLNPSRAKE